MLAKKKNLSEYNTKDVPSSKGMRFGIVVSEWNAEITGSLFKACYDTLIAHGANSENIVKKNVPGSFELPLGAQFFAKYSRYPGIDAIICIGCVIQGETKHFEFISTAVAEGIMNVNLKYNLPVIFCVLTTNDLWQAEERAGGDPRYGKGGAAAIAAIKMVELKRSLLVK